MPPPTVKVYVFSNSRKELTFLLSITNTKKAGRFLPDNYFSGLLFRYLFISINPTTNIKNIGKINFISISKKIITIKPPHKNK